MPKLPEKSYSMPSYKLILSEYGVFLSEPKHTGLWAVFSMCHLAPVRSLYQNITHPSRRFLDKPVNILSQVFKKMSLLLLYHLRGIKINVHRRTRTSQELPVLLLLRVATAAGAACNARRLLPSQGNLRVQSTDAQTSELVRQVLLAAR